MGQLGLDGVLQRGEAVVAQLPGEADDGGGARSGLVGQLGDGAEGDQLRALQDDVGHSPLRWRERRSPLGDATGHIH